MIEFMKSNYYDPYIKQHANNLEKKEYKQSWKMFIKDLYLTKLKLI
jgi:hypothetical protein